MKTTSLKVVAYLAMSAGQLAGTVPGCLLAWKHFGPACGLMLLALAGLTAAKFAGWVVSDDFAD